MLQDQDQRHNHYPLRYPIDYSVSAAKHYISLFQKIRKPNEEQNSMLAAAHYTLALQQDIPLSHSRMHTNAAITLLQNLKARCEIQNSMMANAYFKRAELFEKENAFKAASQDYQKTLEVFQNRNHQNMVSLSNDDKLLLAQSAISLADLLLHQAEDVKQINQQHPLYYINQSLEFLADLPKTLDEIWTTLAYAHQVAGLALSDIDTKAAKEAFRTAIALTFKAEPQIACHMLGDMYNSLGLLYEQEFKQCPIQKASLSLNDQAMIYLGIALFFNDYDDALHAEEQPLIDILFETIYRCLDPFLIPLSHTVLRDFIDALIFIYYCVSDGILPNQTLNQQLIQPQTFNSFAQHIFWLISDLYRKEHYDSNILESIRPCDYDLSLDLRESLASLLNNDQNKVYYLNQKIPSEEIVAP